MNTMNRVELFVKIALFLLFILSLIVFQWRQKHHLNDIYMNAEHIQEELESNIQNGIDAVQYLNVSAQLIIDNKDRMQLKYAPLVEEYDEKGNYNSDHVFDNNVPNEYKANISGYGGLKKDRTTLQEMEMSLYLIRYFKLIKEQNKNFAWVYYYSNKDFVTLYPFSDPKVFVLLPEYKKQPIFQYATPKINPNRELFFTPLYVDNGGLGLMVTLGMPLYDNERFLGITEIDITLASQSGMLKRLDTLGYHSAIINKENEVIALNNIAKTNTKEIIKIDSLLGNTIPNLQDTQGGVSLIEGKYVYSQTFANAPWKFIYYEDASEVLLRSLLYTLPLFMIMGFIFYLGKWYRRTYQLSVELKEEIIHSEIQEAQLAAVISTIPDLIWVKDGSGVYRMCNTSFGNFFGASCGEILGKTDYDFISKEQADFFRQKDREAMESGKMCINEEEIVFAHNGQHALLETRKIPIYHGTEFMGVLGIGRDISEHYKQERLLRQSEEWFRHFFERQLVGMAITSPTYGWIQTNEKLQQMLGYTHEELMQMTWAEMTHPDDILADMEQFNRLLAAEIDDYMLEKRFIRKDGAVIYTKLAISCIRHKDQTIDYVLALIEDITVRKQAQEALVISEREFRSLAENTTDNIVRWDTEGRYLYINPVHERTLNKTSSEIIGTFIPYNHKEVKNAIAQVASTGEYLTIIQTVTTKEGETEYHQVIIAPERDVSGNIISVLGIGRDITEHKKNEDLFNLKQSRLAQMGEMISMIAHQWRQPLGAISTTAGSLELKIDLETFDLETKEGQAEQNLYFKERLKKIRGFVANLTTTIDDFRNFYKPNKRSVTTNYESIITKVMDIMKSSLANDNIELVYNYNSHEEIQMFDSEMMQVLLNIFKNAQDNFKEKQIKNPKITVTTFEKTLKICDNGGGISDEILENIFDPYFSTKSEKNGTGLGLYMSKTIVEEHHNGTLSALNVDEGICITIDLTQEK